MQSSPMLEISPQCFGKGEALGEPHGKGQMEQRAGLDPLQAVIGEVLTLEPWAKSVREGGMGQCLHMVMMLRYRDNVYLSLCNIPDHSDPHPACRP